MATIAVTSTVAGTLVATAGAAPSLSPADPATTPDLSTAAKITNELTSQFEGQDEVDFWIYFDATADLSAAAEIADWDERGAAVVDALQKTASDSQDDVRDQLTVAGVDFQTYWATNAIKVRGGTQDLAQTLAADSAVESLWPSFTVTMPELKPQQTRRAPNGVEWGIGNINADDVWAQYDATGDGLVIANIDSGVQYDHPALIDAYRGTAEDGSVDHNYHWFDASGRCGDTPCDGDGHGTHTMGTMVGDDGVGNQIGVAPGATWIAANGCCDSDETLIRSGEWMLAPRDLSDDPATADPSKRPNIVNNSWGTENPSNQPFMEDISQAWAASGIFGVWSNGNNGPSCRTSGSPGSRTVNYSVGAYDVDNAIAEFSSRGTGQEGEIKPNIAAPGVNVRSSLPGGRYGTANGTSMAAPHVAGAIALLWSASPTLLGDVTGTRALLDGSAVDQADDQCGGTDADNNVFGEGRLDTLALLDAAPTGASGVLSGAVTNAADNKPIADATLTLSGAYDRVLTTDADGTYTTEVPTGDYTVIVSAYGYVDQTLSATVVTDGVTLDVDLDALPSATISGTVLDGSGHGWPLYAKVSVNGDIALSDYTDPATGEYSITVPADTTWTVTVESQYDGYEVSSADVVVGATDVAHDVNLPVDATTCTADGYTYSDVVPVVAEDFSTGEVPAGWSVTDLQGNGETWVFHDSRSRGNRTGGEGAFAVIDSEGYFLSTQHTSLVAPSVDLSTAESAVVTFKQDYEAHDSNDGTVEVEVSVDGGEEWETVLDQAGVSVPGPQATTVDLSDAPGEDDVRVRWRYRSSFGYYWQVDDVAIGTRTCDPVEAGLVIGQVRDRNTGAFLSGATVSPVDDPDQVVTSAATPDDPEVGDGFYWLVSDVVGNRRLSAKAAEYSTGTKRASVRADEVTTTNFRLAAGLITVDTPGVEAELALGRSASRTFTVTNDGTAPAAVELAGRNGTFEILGGGVASTSSVRQLDTASAAATLARSSTASPLPVSGPTFGFGLLDSDTFGPLLPDTPTGFGTSGLDTERSSLPVLPQAASDEVTLTHSVSQEIMVNSIACSGGGTTSPNGFLRVFDLEEFDIETDFNVTTVTFGVEAARGTQPQPITVKLYTLDGDLVYDNLTPIGSAETTLEPQELTTVTVPVEGTAPQGSTLVVELDSPDLGMIGSAFYPGSNDLGETGPTYIRAQECGAVEPTPVASLGYPNMHLVMNVTGEADNSVPWLTIGTETLSLEPGQSAEVTVTMDGQVDQPGTYAGRVRLSEDTPYSTPSVAATMSITPPRSWGKVTGTVTGAACDGAVSPIGDATVQVDWWSGYRTLYTDENGSYAYWLDRRGNPFTFVVAKDGYRPVVRTVKITRGETVIEDFTVDETGC